MRLVKLLVAVLLLAVALPVSAQQVMIAVPPRLTYNGGPCALVTGGGLGPIGGELCWRTDTQQLFWWNLTQWQPIISGVNATLTSPTVIGGIAVSGGLTLTGGASVTGGFVLIGALRSALVFTDSTGTLTTSAPGVVTAPAFSALSTAPGAIQLPGDLTLPVDTGPAFSPGFNAVTLRARSAGPGKCAITAISGVGTVETQLGASFPC